jgi:hypothetical protein
MEESCTGLEKYREQIINAYEHLAIEPLQSPLISEIEK